MPRHFIPVLAAWILLTACGTNTINSSAPAALTPYLTLTPSPTASPETGLILPETVQPTATPFTYIIQTGDTMGALAQKFGVPLDALIAAGTDVFQP